MHTNIVYAHPFLKPHHTVPMDKMHPLGTVPTDKMHPVGTVPIDEIHPVGTLIFSSYTFLNLNLDCAVKISDYSWHP